MRAVAPISAPLAPLATPLSSMSGFIPALRSLKDLEQQISATDPIAPTRFGAILEDLKPRIHHMTTLARTLTSNFGKSPLLAEQRLRDMMFARLRATAKAGTTLKDIYSVAILLPLTSWNSVNSTLCTNMKHAVYVLARDFFAKDQSVDEFLASLKSPESFRATKPKRGQITIVNGSLIALQLRSTQRLPEFLNRLEELVRTALATHPENFEGLPADLDLTRLKLNELCAGVAKYDGSEDMRDPLRNLSPILFQIQNLRDTALKRAEALASARERNSDMNQITDTDVDGVDVSQKMVWREGRWLTDMEILNTLKATVLLPVGNDNTAPGRARQYRSLSKDDLIYIAKKLALNDGLADKWIASLESNTTSTATNQDISDFVNALQKEFEGAVTDPRLLAFYEAAGGSFQPDRSLRQLEDLGKHVDLLIASAMTAAESDNLPGDSLKSGLALALQSAIHFLEDVSHDVRDRVTRANRELMVHAAIEKVGNHYETMATKGFRLQTEEAGYAIIGFEAQHAKLLDTEANPLTPNHRMDVNALKLKRLAHLVAQELFGDEGKSMIEVFGMGDEIAIILPRHDARGQLIDMNQVAATFRKILKEKLFPTPVHYQQKVDVRGKTLRRRQYRAKPSSDFLKGHPNWKHFTVAADPDAVIGSGKDRRAWILTINGAVLKNPLPVTLNDFAPDSFEKIMGLVDCRLCVDFQPLVLRDEMSGRYMRTSDERAEYLLARVNQVFEWDKLVKETRQPNRGIYRKDEKNGKMVLLPG